MGDFIVIAIVLAIVVSAVLYIHKAKKSGKKCIGCPSEGSCGGGCSCGSSCDCGTHIDKK